MTLPVIAVAGRLRPPNPRKGRNHPSVAVPAPEIRALHRAGGQEAVLLPVELDQDDARRRLERFDGLMLIGGGDLEPARYGENARSEVYGVQAERDAFELALVRAAVEFGVPTLAICRGIQVLNVALGGTLEQHLPAVEGTIPHGNPGTREPVTHRVTLEPGSRAAVAMGTTRPTCSSHHHQAPAKIGDGLVITGQAEDGVVEAVEMEDGWVVGVQWHPEDTAGDDRAQQGLFDALVERAGRA